MGMFMSTTTNVTAHAPGSVLLIHVFRRKLGPAVPQISFVGVLVQISQVTCSHGSAGALRFSLQSLVPVFYMVAWQRR
jgi:hypothetical protein